MLKLTINPMFKDSSEELVFALLNGQEVSQDAFLGLCQLIFTDGVENHTEFINKFVKTEQNDNSNDGE